MPLLNEADGVLLGATSADAVYLGDEKVWPLGNRAPDPADFFSGTVYAYIDFGDPSTFTVTSGKVTGVTNLGTLGGTLGVYGSSYRPTLSEGGAPNGTDCMITDDSAAVYKDYPNQISDASATLVAVFALDDDSGTNEFPVVNISRNGNASGSNLGFFGTASLTYLFGLRGANTPVFEPYYGGIGNWMAAACLLSTRARLLDHTGLDTTSSGSDSNVRFNGRISMGGATTLGGRCRLAMGAVIDGNDVNQAKNYLSALATHYGL